MDRTIKISKELAKKWYSSDNKEFKELALQAYTEKELTLYSFKEITTFDKALDAYTAYYEPYKIGTHNIFINKSCIKDIIKNIKQWSKASAAKVKLDIIRKVLNAEYDMHLTKDVDDQNYIWYPYFRFITKSCTYYNSELKNGTFKKIGNIISEGVTYNVLGGDAYDNSTAGLGNFNSHYGVGSAAAASGFLGCATKEIAKYFGEHFGMLIMEAMYGDLEDFKIITSLY